MDTDRRDKDAALFFAVDAGQVILGGNPVYAGQRGLFAIQWNEIQPPEKADDSAGDAR